MINILNFYTHWIIMLSLIEKYTNINVYPSLIVCLLGSTLMSFYFNVDISVKLILILLHLLPFIWVEKDTSNKTIIHNIFIAITYILFISIQKQTIYQVYKKQFLFLKTPNLFKKYLLKGKFNLCFCC